MWWVGQALAGTPDCAAAPGTQYAQSVVAFTAGAGVQPAYADPSNALGAPDFREGAGAVSLGNRAAGVAELVVSFGAAWLVDGPGADLVVFEEGPSAEPTELAVSVDGVTWFDVGVVAGSVHEVDLQGRVPAGQRFALVRLRTASERAARGPWAGPDVDAVGLLHACTVRRLNS
jgi:hypothetical protein